MEQLLAENRIWFGANGTAFPRLKRFLSDVQQGRRASTIWMHEEVGHTDEATKEFREIFKDSGVTFSAPKPTRLIEQILRLTTSPSADDIVMDFFSGSGTTAQAVLQMNKSDSGKRRFILVQIPEAFDAESDEFKAGFRTIADIGKERIRRSGAKLKEDMLATNLDTGFRVLKIDTSNMNDVYYTPDAVKQENLLGQVDNVRTDRTAQDLLFQLLVDWGLDLSMPIVEETIAGKKVFFADGNALAACFDTEISEELVKELAGRKPLRAVFRDASFTSDSLKINVEQIFKLLSPETEVASV
jgi:adenine-specific DNA-methyltransferase